MEEVEGGTEGDREREEEEDEEEKPHGEGQKMLQSVGVLSALPAGRGGGVEVLVPIPLLKLAEC